MILRFMRHGEEGAVCHLVHRAFDLSVAPLYKKKGRRNFKEYADPSEMGARINAGHFVLLAQAGGEIAGMIEVRHNRHITLLFVEPKHQGRGVGRNLVEHAVDHCRQSDPQLTEVTVNSSPNALKAYERMGFVATGMEQEINGVRFVPMRKSLD